MKQTLIKMQNIVKVFPPEVVALDDVTVAFNEGEIHAIVGENGAGKSTLMKILYGMQPADQGQLFLKSQPVAFQNSSDAIKSGIGMVHQEILLIDQYTVWENVILGLEPTNFLGFIDQKEARDRVQENISAYDFNLNPEDRISEISIGARQKVEILKLLYRNVNVLILDEPTAVLTPQEIPRLFDQLMQLRESGHTILFISHHLDEVMELSDRITVLRHGRKIATVPTAQTSKVELAEMMVGREVIFTSLRQPKTPGKIVFKVQNLNYQDLEGKQRLSNIHLEVRESEIVGVAGVEGNGQLALVNTIMGRMKAQSGEITCDGEPIQDATILERRKKLAFVSQDRSRLSASLNASIMDNAIMSHHRLNPSLTECDGRLLNPQSVRLFTQKIEKSFSVDMGGPEDLFLSLSGGNQQKLILGRELTLDTPFLLLDQPTRGLDVGSIEYVHRQILAMRDEGHGILLLSSNLDELFRLSDRILVLHRGMIVGQRRVEETTIEEIGLLMLKGEANHEGQ